MIEIIEMFVPKTNTFSRPGYKMSPTSITIHETDNNNVRANARAHALLQYNGNLRQASWHLQVDDEKEVYQSLPFNEVAWHAGTSDGNYTSIAMEICVNKDGNYKKAVANAIELTKHLIKLFPSINSVNVVQHNHWSGKNCPRHLRAGDWGINWKVFIDGVKSKASSNVKPVEKPKYTTTNTAFKIGQTVRVKKSAKAYATGQSIASFVKGSTYKIKERGSNRLLLSEINSWVKTSDVEAVSLTTNTSNKPKPKANLKVDNIWGQAVNAALQNYFNTPVDKILSHQYNNKTIQGINKNAIQLDNTLIGSTVIKALQKYLGVKQDGILGEVTIKALQRHLGTYPDGIIDRNSPMVGAMQRRLNAGKL